MARNDDMVVIQCQYKLETPAAWLVIHDGEEYWFPKSKCEWHDPEMHVPEWLLIEKGIL